MGGGERAAVSFSNMSTCILSLSPPLTCSSSPQDTWWGARYCGYNRFAGSIRTLRVTLSSKGASPGQTRCPVCVSASSLRPACSLRYK